MTELSTRLFYSNKESSIYGQMLLVDRSARDGSPCTFVTKATGTTELRRVHSREQHVAKIHLSLAPLRGDYWD